MTLPEAVLRARLLAQTDSSRLDLVTVASPGSSASIEATLVHEFGGGFWVVTHDDALMLDDVLWAAYHRDPSEDIIGRVRVSIVAL